MIACFLSNISAKCYKNPSMLSRVIAKKVGDVFFLRHSVYSSVSRGDVFEGGMFWEISLWVGQFQDLELSRRVCFWDLPRLVCTVLLSVLSLLNVGLGWWFFSSKQLISAVTAEWFGPCRHWDAELLVKRWMNVFYSQPAQAWSLKDAKFSHPAYCNVFHDTMLLL